MALHYSGYDSLGEREREIQKLVVQEITKNPNFIAQILKA